MNQIIWVLEGRKGKEIASLLEHPERDIALSVPGF